MSDGGPDPGARVMARCESAAPDDRVADGFASKGIMAQGRVPEGAGVSPRAGSPWVSSRHRRISSAGRREGAKT
ncbi:hypothetical protein AKI39_23885 [Bordetella sp. H567]|nr:hypothetical protein AKI39_23885 [Bordetella sp. H567]